MKEFQIIQIYQIRREFETKEQKFSHYDGLILKIVITFRKIPKK